MPTGWDRYLVAHEAGTHSVLGAIVCGVLAAVVASVLRRPAGFPSLLIPAIIGSTSHVLADLLSGASIRLGWPLVDARVSNLGVVAMAEPIIIGASLAGAIALFLWPARRTQIAVVVLSAFALVTVEKTLLRERAELAYRDHQAGREAGGAYLIEPVWGAMMEWRIFDRTEASARAWTVDASGNVSPYAQVALAAGNSTLINASVSWSTVRNFRRAHDFAFAVATPAGVEWSDLRYCGPSTTHGVHPSVRGARVQRETPECGVWAGGEFSSAPALKRLIVRVGDLVQTR